MEPSITSTNGASSSPRAACRNGNRNSSPPSVGESTLLCRFTLGRPGIAPRSTSSMPGCPAAVIDTESPSQLIPSEIHRMWTSSTPDAFCSTAMRHPFSRHVLFDLERVDEELLAVDQLTINSATALAPQRQVAEHRLC